MTILLNTKTFVYINLSVSRSIEHKFLDFLSFGSYFYVKLYDPFHIQRAISVPDLSDAKNLQNIDIYGPNACFAYSHKKSEKVTRSQWYGRFIGRKSPQNTLFLTFFLCRMQNSIFVWTSPDNTNPIKKLSLKKY